MRASKRSLCGSILCIAVWSCVAVHGGDELTPGKHRKVPCVTNPKYTYDIFIPEAYAEQKEKRFPVLFVSCPYNNPNGYGMYPWAEKNDMVVVSVNDNKNGIPAKTVNEIQDAVVHSVEQTVRIHRVLRFSMGQSGGGSASMNMAHRFQDNWAGLVMLVHSGDGSQLPRHIAVAFLAGVKDDVHSIDAIRRSYKSIRGRGNPVRIKEYPDKGHNLIAQEGKEDMLAWMLNHQRVHHPLLNDEERREMEVGLKKRLAAALACEDPAKQVAEIEAVLAYPRAAKWENGREAQQVWVKAKFAQVVAQEDPVTQFSCLKALQEHEWARAADPDDQKKIKDRLRELSRNDAVRAERKARKMLDKILAFLEKAGSDEKRMKKAARGLKKLIERYPDTPSAAEAKEKREAIVP